MFSVTVITPIYNRKKYVAKMIKMLKAQTLSNREIFTAFFYRESVPLQKVQEVRRCVY